MPLSDELRARGLRGIRFGWRGAPESTRSAYREQMREALAAMLAKVSSTEYFDGEMHTWTSDPQG